MPARLRGLYESDKYLPAVPRILREERQFASGRTDAKTPSKCWCGTVAARRAASQKRRCFTYLFDSCCSKAPHCLSNSPQVEMILRNAAQAIQLKKKKKTPTKFTLSTSDNNPRVQPVCKVHRAADYTSTVLKHQFLNECACCDVTKGTKTIQVFILPSQKPSQATFFGLLSFSGGRKQRAKCIAFSSLLEFQGT